MKKQNSMFSRLFSLVDKAICKAEVFVLCWGVIIMALNSIANVFGRYVFSQSIYFTEELNAFLIVLITFMGLGYVTRKGRHIRMSALYDMLADKHKKILMIIIAALTALAMFVLAWYAFEYVAKIARRGRVTPALQAPLYLTYVWVVVGFVITGIQYLLTVVKNLNLSDPDVYISFTEIDRYEDPDVAEVLHLYNADHGAENNKKEEDE